MSKMYDNWDRLVGAVLKREDLKRLARSQSLSSSISVDFSFDSFLEDILSEPIEYEEIKKATKKYRPVEQGGIGIAFKGWLDEHTLTAAKHGSGMPVAVQWNHGGPQEHREWLEKIKYSCQLSHPNLVKFIGYCLEEDKMVSVYEFMSKGSLDLHLFGVLPGLPSLSWETRVKVAIGAARGLSFLHNNEVRPIIHGDIKTANILLNGDFSAKLTNFGLARDGPTGVSTEVMGCVYAAPEYVATGQLTTECDVYSFGVVLLQLLSGRGAYNTNWIRKQCDLVDWAKPYLGSKRKVLRIMDIRLEGQYSDDAAYKVAKLVSQCLSLDPKLRPRMDEVVLTLQQM